MQLTVGQSVIQLGVDPSGTHDQILVAVKTIMYLFVVGRSSVERTGLTCNASLSCTSHLRYKDQSVNVHETVSVCCENRTEHINS